MRRIVLAAAVLGTLACGRPGPPNPKQGLGWRVLGSWSGRGDAQTESVTSESGQLRVRWRMAGERAGGTGTFRLTAHSAISGRPMEVAVDRRGAGEGTAYVDQDPHVFYFTVESADVDWSFSLDEAAAGTLLKAP